MNWRLILKDPKNQPAQGVYNDWKEQIAEECYHQCVYCSIHENPWGGIDHYHIDHFRPKSNTKFAHLENDICNLFYSCPVCNRFKKDDWPADPDLNVVSYPDPSVTDYASLFDLDTSSHKIIGKYVAANYLIERLYLNRAQLIYERREKLLNDRYYELTNEISALVQASNDFEIATKFINAIVGLTNHMRQRKKIRPYTLSEIKKHEADKPAAKRKIASAPKKKRNSSTKKKKNSSTKKKKSKKVGAKSKRKVSKPKCQRIERKRSESEEKEKRLILYTTFFGGICA